MNADEDLVRDVVAIGVADAETAKRMPHVREVTLEQLAKTIVETRARRARSVHNR